MKIVADESVDYGVILELRKNGYDVLAIEDSYKGSEDEMVLEISLKENSLLMTEDKDFGELVFNSGMSHYGVLLLRLDDSDGDEKVEIIKEILTKYEGSLRNKFCVYQNSRLRIKKG